MIKTPTSKELKANFPFLQKTYARRGGIWSRGYRVLCIGMDEKDILACVENQEKEDKGQLQLVLPQCKTPPASAGGGSLFAFFPIIADAPGDPITCLIISIARAHLPGMTR